jgi:hypothetical protein
VEKYGTARQATADNIIRRRKDAICTPDNSGKNTHTHTHTHNTKYLLPHNWLIPSHLVKRFTATLTKTYKLRNDLCRYDLYSQIVRLKKAMSKRTFFCFNAASGTLHEDLRMFYCCWRHKFAIKHCCATLSIFIQLTVTCSSTTHTECNVVSTATMVTRKRHDVTLYIHYLFCYILTWSVSVLFRFIKKIAVLRTSSSAWKFINSTDNTANMRSKV